MKGSRMSAFGEENAAAAVLTCPAGVRGSLAAAVVELAVPGIGGADGTGAACGESCCLRRGVSSSVPAAAVPESTGVSVAGASVGLSLVLKSSRHTGHDVAT